MAFGSTELGTLVVRLNADISRFEANMSRMERRMHTSMGNVTAIATKSAAIMGAAVAGVSVIGLKRFADFEESMIRSTAIMGDLSDSVKSNMESVARQLSTGGVQSASDLAEAYFFLASAGLNAQQSIAALPVVQKFATAGAFNLATATDLLTDAQSALGMVMQDTNANQAEMIRLSDVLVKANTLANATVEQFSRSLTSKAGAALRLLNKDVEEGVAVLAAYADQGVKAELAGERLNIMLRDLQTASLNNRSEWRRLGVSVYDAEGNMRSIVDIVRQLESVLSGASDEQQRLDLMTLGFTDRSVSAITSILGLSDKIEGYEKALRSAGGTTEDISDKQMRSINAQFSIIKNRVNEAFIAIGQSLAPVLGVLIEKLDNAYIATNGFKNEIQLVSDVILTSFVVAGGVAADVIAGWKLIVLGGRAAILGFAESIQMIVFQFKNAAFEIKKDYDTISTLTELAFRRVILTLTETLNEFSTQINTAINAFNGFSSAMNALKGTPLVLVNQIDDLGGSIAVMNDEINRLSVDNALNSFFGDLDGKASLIAKYRDESLDFSGALESVKGELDALLASGRPSEMMLSRLKEIQSEINAVITNSKSDVSLATEPSSPNDGEPKSDADREKEKWLEYFTWLEDKESEVADARAKIGAHLTATMTGLIGELAGRNSSAYKAMFAAHKAFAIAMATINISKAISDGFASETTIYGKLAAVSMIMSETANIVSSIKSVRMGGVASFLGGGMVADGPRVGGVDNMGGKFAVVHPGEKIIDPKSTNTSQSGNVYIYNNAPVQVESEVDEMGNVRVFVEQIQQSIAGGIRNKTGDVWRALRETTTLQPLGT